MYHIVFLLLVAALSLLGWNLIMSAPRVLAMVLPRKLTIGIGVTLMILGSTGAFFAAQMSDAGGVISCILQVYLGLWWFMATSAGQRGSYNDDQAMRRLFILIGCMLIAIISGLFINDVRVVAIMTLLMVAGAFWVVTNYFSFLDRGR